MIVSGQLKHHACDYYYLHAPTGRKPRKLLVVVLRDLSNRYKSDVICSKPLLIDSSQDFHCPEALNSQKIIKIMEEKSYGGWCVLKRRFPSLKRDISSLPPTSMTEILVLLREAEERSNDGKKRTPKYLEMV